MSEKNKPKEYNSPLIEELLNESTPEELERVDTQMSKKQTATEWLFEKLWETPKDKLNWNALLEEAKEIHEKQSIEDMNKMQIVRHINYINEVKFSFNPEQYYKETYGE